MSLIGTTRQFHEAVKEAGWPANVLAAYCHCDTERMQEYLDKGYALPRESDDRLRFWLNSKVGQAADGLLYVDQYTPPITMPPVIAPDVILPSEP